MSMTTPFANFTSVTASPIKHSSSPKKSIPPIRTSETLLREAADDKNVDYSLKYSESVSVAALERIVDGSGAVTAPSKVNSIIAFVYENKKIWE